MMQDKSYPDNFLMNLYNFLSNNYLFAIHHICSQDFADADLKGNKKNNLCCADRWSQIKYFRWRGLPVRRMRE